MLLHLKLVDCMTVSCFIINGSSEWLLVIYTQLLACGLTAESERERVCMCLNGRRYTVMGKLQLLSVACMLSLPALTAITIRMRARSVRWVIP